MPGWYTRLYQEIKKNNPPVCKVIPHNSVGVEVWDMFNILLARSRGQDVPPYLPLDFPEQISLAVELVRRWPTGFALLTGICVAGPILLVNTNQLAWFCNRSKSSVEKQFVRLGYATILKAEIRDRLIEELFPDSTGLRKLRRQMTVRLATWGCRFSFGATHPPIEPDRFALGLLQGFPPS